MTHTIAPRLTRRLAVGVVALALLTPLAVQAQPVTVGRLVAIGGGTEDPALLKEVLALAKGEASRVAILNTASSDPDRSGPAYQRFFQSLGVKEAMLVPLLGREQAYQPAVLDAIGRADLIYVTGGNQIRLAQAVHDTPAHGALLAAFQRGAVIAGTSAGAMVWGPRYLAAGTSDGALKGQDLDMRPGLGLVPQLVLDTHFAREARLGRLLVATSQSPGTLGVGVDERTAAVITAEGVRVLGHGRVTVLDLKEAKLPPKPAATFSIRDVRMHLLGGSDSLRFRREASERQPMLPPRSREAAELPSLWLQGSAAPSAAIGLLTSRTGRLPEEVLILAGSGATEAAQGWRQSLMGRGALNVRVLAAHQLTGNMLSRYLTTPSGLLMVDDADRSLGKALMGAPGQQLRSHVAKLPLGVAGEAVAIPGETSMKPGAGSPELLPGLRLAPGLVTTPNVWAPDAFDRLVLDSLLAGGALGVGLSPDNALRLEAGRLKAEGASPVFLVDTDTVSLANPSMPSARDLTLQVLAPGEEMPF
ncbi:MAG: cyanophycinase [Candidatus Sericytochromatia bacterium]